MSQPPGRFRKRPVVIEAMPYDGTSAAGSEIIAWAAGSAPAGDVSWSNALELRVTTLEGVMIARPGDWVLRGVQGEFYPIKGSIFDATYEPAEEP